MKSPQPDSTLAVLGQASQDWQVLAHGGHVETRCPPLADLSLLAPGRERAPDEDTERAPSALALPGAAARRETEKMSRAGGAALVPCLEASNSDLVCV